MPESALSKKNFFSQLTQITVGQSNNNYIPTDVIVYVRRTKTYIRFRDVNRKNSYENCKKG